MRGANYPSSKIPIRIWDLGWVVRLVTYVMFELQVRLESPTRCTVSSTVESHHCEK